MQPTSEDALACFAMVALSVVQERLAVVSASNPTVGGGDASRERVSAPHGADTRSQSGPRGRPLYRDRRHACVGLIASMPIPPVR